MKIAKASVNGIAKDPSEIKIPAHAVGAFESFRVHAQKVFLLDEHFDRLAKSLRALGLSWDDDRSKYAAWISDLCADLPKDKDAFVRFTVTGDVIIQVRYIPFFIARSFKAKTLSEINLNKSEVFNKFGFRIKSVDYINERLLLREASGLDPSHEGILLSPNGYVAEALSANIFWSKDGRLLTPPLDLGILAGTMRDYLIKNHRVEESLISAEELKQADEIILTSGASYLRPLDKIDGVKKPGANGAVFKKLYSKLQSDIAKQSKQL